MLNSGAKENKFIPAVTPNLLGAHVRGKGVDPYTVILNFSFKKKKIFFLYVGNFLPLFRT